MDERGQLGDVCGEQQRQAGMMHTCTLQPHHRADFHDCWCGEYSWADAEFRGEPSA
jgi:hypothetical protein